MAPVSAPVLTAIPDEIRAGTTVQYTREISDYSAADGWQLDVYLKGKSATSLVWNTDVVASGTAFLVTIPVAKTTALSPGTYQWYEQVTKGGEVHEADSGTLVVLQNLAAAAAGDALSPEEKWLADVEAAISGLITNGVAEYEISTPTGGRRVTRRDLDDLYSLRVRLQAAVARQRNPDGVIEDVQFQFRRPS